MERLVSPHNLEEDFTGDISLRPLRLAEYIGQNKVRDNIAIFIQAAGKKRAFRSCYYQGLPVWVRQLWLRLCQ